MEQVKTAILSPAARRLPAPRQGRPGHLPRRAPPSSRCRPRTRSTSRPRGSTTSPPAGGPRWPRGCSRPPACSSVERVRDPRRRPLLVVVTDGRATSGPDAVAPLAAGRRPGSRPAAWRPWSSTARAAPLRLGLAAVLADHLRAEHVPVAEVTRRGAHRRAVDTSEGGLRCRRASRPSSPTTGSPPGSAATGRC